MMIIMYALVRNWYTIPNMLKPNDPLFNQILRVIHSDKKKVHFELKQSFVFDTYIPCTVPKLFFDKHAISATAPAHEGEHNVH